jgi:hypothetical protein
MASEQLAHDQGATVSATTIQPYHGSYLMPRLEHATVSDAMHPGILSCETDATLTGVARLMATHHVHCVAVMGSRTTNRARSSSGGSSPTSTSCGPESARDGPVRRRDRAATDHQRRADDGAA